MEKLLQASGAELPCGADEQVFSLHAAFEIPEEMSDLSTKHIDDITKILVNELQFIKDY